ncbi:MAG TPA: pectate lyase [Gemmataceae bacterium]|nr:pectate lyase [Gemmataceae bacterium]
MSRFAILAACLVGLTSDLPAQEDAAKALKTAATYYRDKVARHGGYVYFTSADLKERWGEGKAGPDTIFVQPPGTPTVGMAYLRAYEATGDTFYLDAARETAEALVAGQLQSGGWTQVIHFGPANRLGKYRTRPGGNWNASSLDDDQTQSALHFLFAADKALGFKHEAIHEAARYGLDALLKAQFPNGAFPQVWTKPVEAKSVGPAKYPDYDWKTEGRVKNYWDYYTLNDGLAGTVAATLHVAWLTYKDEKALAAIKNLGDFLVLAQMPDPQPGWCQQYGYDMVPIWARQFEPPAVTGGESQDVMETLITIARWTGDQKYLEPIPKALAYFKKSLLSDGKVARYYELKTNKPLYMDAAYRLTYDDSAAPDHYGWKQPARFDRIEKAYRAARDGREQPTGKAVPSADAVRKVMADLDAEGRWVSTHAGERLVGQPKFEKGFRYLSSTVFSKNVETLSAFIAAGRE